MPIATTGVGKGQRRTLATLIHVNAQGRGATDHQVIHHPRLFSREWVLLPRRRRHRRTAAARRPLRIWFFGSEIDGEGVDDHWASLSPFDPTAKS